MHSHGERAQILALRIFPKSCGLWGLAQILALPLCVGNLPVLSRSPSQSSQRRSCTGCEHAESKAAMAGGITPPFEHLLTMALLWRTWAPSEYTPVCGPHHTPSPFSLSLHSQPQSSPRVCLLKPEFQYPAPAHTSRWVFQAGECSKVAWTICTGLSLFCQLQPGYCTLL